MNPQYEAWYRKDACDCAYGDGYACKDMEIVTGFATCPQIKKPEESHCSAGRQTGKLSLVSKPWEQMKN
jgi:hypothetical protein